MKGQTPKLRSEILHLMSTETEDVKINKEDYAIGSRIVTWLPDTMGEVEGIVLNKKKKPLGNNLEKTLYLVSTPIEILWVRQISDFQGENFRKCLRPDPVLVKRADLLPEHIKDYLGSWEFVYHHADIYEA